MDKKVKKKETEKKSEKGQNKFIELEPELEESASDIVNEMYELQFMSDLSEGLDRQQRRKVGLRMKRLKKRLAIARKKEARKAPTRDKVVKRSRRGAISAVKKKVSGGRNYSDMSFAQKKVVDNKVEKRKGMIDRIARKLMPSKRRKK